MRTNWKTLLGMAVSALLLWWVFRGEDLGAIARRLADADLILLALSGLVTASGGLVRAARWRLLLEPLGVSTSLYARWASLNIGFMVTNVLPARLGEIVRPFALARMTSVPMSGALGTVVLARLLDVVALLVLLVLSLAAPGFPDDAQVFGRSIGWAVSGAIVAGLAALALLAVMLAWPESVTRLVRVAARLLPGHLEETLVTGVRSFIVGLEVLRRPSALARALGWSLLLWLWMAGAFWAAFRAFGIDLGPMAAIFTQCAVSIFVALPAGPGFIGTMQAGVSVAVHEIYGVAAEPTLSLAVGFHLAAFVPVTLLGFYYAWRLGLRLGSVGSDAEAALSTGARDDAVADREPRQRP